MKGTCLNGETQRQMCYKLDTHKTLVHSIFPCAQQVEQMQGPLQGCMSRAKAAKQAHSTRRTPSTADQDVKYMRTPTASGDCCAGRRVPC